MKITYLKDSSPEPWLPPELEGSEWARKVLGVLLKYPDEPNAEGYLDLHDEKVLEMLRQAPVREKDNPQNLLEDLLPEEWERLGEKASPEQILEAMKVNAPGWQRQRRLLAKYLDQELSLSQLREELGLDDEYKSLVSRSEFKKELEELTLREFLELAT
jgi:hypothetical protein